MVEEYGLQQIMVPFEDELKSGAGQTPIFKSEDWDTNQKGALLLIQGSGDVRPGCWTRSVCIKDNIELGSMLPDIQFAKDNGFSVLIVNPNYTKDVNGNRVDSKVDGCVKH